MAAAQHALDAAFEEAETAPKRTDAEEAELLRKFMETPIDPDVELVQRYVDANLTSEQMAAVEERLAEDEEFRVKVAPMRGGSPSRKDSYAISVSRRRSIR